MLHPQCAAVLALSAGAPEFIDLPIAQTRAAAYERPSLAGPINERVRINNRLIAGPTGDLLIRIYTPPTPGPHRGLVFLHGGGWVFFSIDFYDAQLSNLSEASDSVIIAVNYQKAPEHKFPIPHDDSHAALAWTFANAAKLGIDPTRIGIGGDSAGGNLAAGVALRVRDESSYKLAYQLLIYPCLGLDFESDSFNSNAVGYGLTKRSMSWVWGLYLDFSKDARNPYAVPLSATDLAGLPPTIIMTAEYDVLRDDGVRYAAALREAGNRVIEKDFAGMIHGFFNYGAYIDETANLNRWILEGIDSIIPR